jgi:hypothetical protein
MSNNSSSVPGLSLPTMQSMPAGNPRDSAIANSNAMNAKQNSANQMAGSKKRGGSINIPQFTMSYPTTGGPGQDPNSLITGNSQTSTQGAANSVFDKNIANGGSRRRRRGGNTNWNWGCYSGGKKRRTRSNKRKTRRHRKKTRRYKK